ncbi:MAG: ATP-binding protein [Erysipelotrichaceae bacterium]|nr:ATP-binding protein [Erysipelotrichaceae bacterium]
MRKMETKLKSDFRFDRNKLEDEVLADYRIAKLINDGQLSIEEARENVFMLAGWLKSEKKCSECRGLADCSYDPKGYHRTLEFVNGIPNEVMAVCRYLKESREAVRHEKNYLMNYLSRKQLLYSLDKIDRREESPRYLEIVDTIEKWLESGTWKGIYLFGSIGVGKSYLAACISNLMAREGKKTAFVHVPSFFSDARNSIGSDEDFVDDSLRKLKRAEFLVLDDIGAENITEWVRDDLLLPVLDYRMENHLTTFFTSNLSLNDLKKHYTYTSNGSDELKAERIVERIRAITYQLPMSGNSRR